MNEMLCHCGVPVLDFVYFALHIEEFHNDGAGACVMVNGERDRLTLLATEWRN